MSNHRTSQLQGMNMYAASIHGVPVRLLAETPLRLRAQVQVRGTWRSTLKCVTWDAGVQLQPWVEDEESEPKALADGVEAGAGAEEGTEGAATEVISAEGEPVEDEESEPKALADAVESGAGAVEGTEGVAEDPVERKHRKRTHPARKARCLLCSRRVKARLDVLQSHAFTCPETPRVVVGDCVLCSQPLHSRQSRGRHYQQHHPGCDARDTPLRKPAMELLIRCFGSTFF